MNRKRNRLWPILGVNLFFAAVFYYLNTRTGFFADDFGYMYQFSLADKLTALRVTDLADVFSSQYAHYFLMNGRSVAHFLLQTALISGKSGFDLINTAVYVIFSLAAYHLIKKEGEPSLPLAVLVYAVPLFFLQMFGQVMLFATLAANYFWTATLLLLFSLPFKKLFFGKDPFARRPKVAAGGMLLFGILAGWASENGSAAVIFLVILIGIRTWAVRRKLPGWFVTALIGQTIGFIMMVSSPGYAVQMRESHYIFDFWKQVNTAVDETFLYAPLILTGILLLGASVLFRLRVSPRVKWAATAVLIAVPAAAFWRQAAATPLQWVGTGKGVCGAAAVLTAVFFAVAIRRGGVKSVLTHRTLWAGIFMLAGLAANGAMAASPRFQNRSLMFFFVLWMLGCLVLLTDACRHIRLRLPRLKRFRMVPAAAVFLVTAVSLIPTCQKAETSYRQYQNRVATVEQMKAAQPPGQAAVVFTRLDDPRDPRLVVWNMSNNDPNYWINKAICQYYGVRSVTHE